MGVHIWPCNAYYSDDLRDIYRQARLQSCVSSILCFVNAVFRQFCVSAIMCFVNDVFRQVLYTV